MSIATDKWGFEALQRMRQHIGRQQLAGRDYSPDTTYEQLKRGECGPHTVVMSDTLRRWALMWAADMREIDNVGISRDETPAASFAAAMREADAEIDRYRASHNLVRAA